MCSLKSLQEWEKKLKESLWVKIFPLSLHHFFRKKFFEKIEE